MAASSTREIPPGGEGKITVKVSTSGYGEKSIRKSVRIQTNDPEHPYLSVVITGFVDTFADLSKKQVRLFGEVSDRLYDQVVITPKAEYPFTIEDIKARTGRYISFQIKEELNQGKRRYVLTIENIRKDKGNYSDVVLIFIDSALKKVIPIYVVGHIREKNQ